MVDLVINYLGGNCPVQAEGTVSGKPFYFRSRGEHWSMSIGGDCVIDAPEWYYEEVYGEFPAAGWISKEEALEFMNKAAELWLAELVTP